MPKLASTAAQSAVGCSRRTFLRLVAGGGAALLLGACGGQPPQVAEQNAPTAADAAPVATNAATAPAVATSAVTVTLWGWWPERMQIFERAAQEFTAANPNVTIKVETLGEDLWPKIFASVPAGTGPTLCKMQTTNYFKLREQDLLVELPSDVFPRSFLTTNYPTHNWDAYGAYCIPEGGQAAIFAYNKAMFAEVGLDPDKPPTTWDEFFTAAEQLTQRDGDTITRAGFAPDDWLPTLNTLYQLGGSPVEQTGDTLNATLTTPEVTRAFQFFVDAAQRKVWDPSFPYFTDAIGNQQAAMTIGEAWAYGTWKSDFPDTYANLGFAAPPTPTGAAQPFYGRQNSVLGLAAIKNKPDEETAAGLRFMEYLYKERLDAQFELANIAGLVPAHAELTTDPRVTNDPFLRLAAELLPKQHDAVEVSDALNKTLGDALNRVVLEGTDLAASLATAQTELQGLIESGEVKYLR